MKTPHSSSALFLLEIIIAVLFFSLASAVCVQMFAKAHMLSEKTAAQNKAAAFAQSLEEEFYAKDGSMQNSSVYYDSAWNPLSSEDGASYAVITAVSGNADPVCTVTVTSLRDSSTVYSLSAKIHVRRRAS